MRNSRKQRAGLEVLVDYAEREQELRAFRLTQGDLLTLGAPFRAVKTQFADLDLLNGTSALEDFLSSYEFQPADKDATIRASSNSSGSSNYSRSMPWSFFANESATISLPSVSASAAATLTRRRVSHDWLYPTLPMPVRDGGSSRTRSVSDKHIAFEEKGSSAGTARPLQRQRRVPSGPRQRPW